MKCDHMYSKVSNLYIALGACRTLELKGTKKMEKQVRLAEIHHNMTLKTKRQHPDARYKRGKVG